MDDIVNMWASPRRGKPPASGQIRAITVFHPDDNEEFGFTVKPPKRKVLQGI